METVLTPWIVADFDFAGRTWLVVLWNGEGEFDVYGADVPWTWLCDAVDARGPSPSARKAT